MTKKHFNLFLFLRQPLYSINRNLEEYQQSFQKHMICCLLGGLVDHKTFEYLQNA